MKAQECFDQQHAEKSDRRNDRQGRQQSLRVGGEEDVDGRFDEGLQDVAQQHVRAVGP